MLNEDALYRKIGSICIQEGVAPTSSGTRTQSATDKPSTESMAVIHPTTRAIASSSHPEQTPTADFTVIQPPFQIDDNAGLTEAIKTLTKSINRQRIKLHPVKAHRMANTLKRHIR
ncbi:MULTISPECIES: hypothetical protein [unclassified Pseudomonas]|jgi:hypothetical protein|uniref:hypothetical protein n=1 Tax=unclassified Pseudomonas TaxID=196821 RepID=UPI001C47F2BD|nr:MULTISPECIES: hypothetical protein [unclassified Pseudomonas]MBV7527049.1 hypothetical protein [Pseudomonas sp. PDM29]